MIDNQEKRVKAALLFRDAANKGHPEAQFEYGKCLRDGDGVLQNQQEATEWFRKAANAGHPGATQALNALQRPEQPALQMAHATPPTTNLPTAEKAAHDKGLGLAFIVGFIAFIVLQFVCSDTVGGGLFSESEPYINWPGVFIGTGICAFIAYHIGKNA